MMRYRAPSFSFALAAALALTTGAWDAGAQADDEGDDLSLAALEDEVTPAVVCLPGDHTGVSDDSATTAFGVVCDALRRAGAQVTRIDPSPAKRDSAYRIDLQRLEQVVLLRITYESPLGVARDSRTLSLNGVDEVLVGADRIAVALLEGKPVEETAKVDTLVGTETRNYQKKAGETYFGAGILGLAVPSVGVYTGAGIELPGFYETPSFAVGGALRVTVTGGDDDKRATFGSLSAGGRAFLMEGDVTPYIGGGFAFGWLSLSEESGPGRQFNGSAEGFGAFGEAGVEMLRLHRTRFLIGVRVDAPFFTAKETTYIPWTSSSSGELVETRRRYAMPITLNVTFLPFKI